MDLMRELVTSRRAFLKGVGVASLAALAAYTGNKVLYADNGTYPVEVSPYAQFDTIERWPEVAREASPILILLNDRSDNPFGPYYGEILRAEGLNAFQVAWLSNIGDAPLEWYDTVLLCDGPVRVSERERLEFFVGEGGNLIAMRPDDALAALCGLESLGRESPEGYLRVNGSHPIGTGIALETMQYHGPARHFRPISAETVCLLTADRDDPLSFPGITVSQVGKGRVGAWAFDLARSIVLMRQGNPALADVSSPQWDGIRPINLFVKWVDLECARLPQADEQQRLLANMLANFGQNGRPLPRLWYFPGSARCMLIATADCHGNSAEAIDELLTTFERRGGHASIYYTPTPESELRRAVKRTMLSGIHLPIVGASLDGAVAAPAPSDVAAFRKRGHEFGLHPYVDDYSVEPGLVPGWKRYWKEFTGLGYGPVPPTTRTHRIQWSGWTETARVQASFGIEMNLDYYHWGPLFRDESGTWTYGHLTGSGLPMRFIDSDGMVLNIYQQLTHMADDHLLAGDWGGYVGLNGESATLISQRYLSDSLQGQFAAITANFHVDPLDAGGHWADEFRKWMQGTLDYAADHDVPIWSAAEWLNFTRGRHDSVFKNLGWDPQGNSLAFDVLIPGEVTGGLSLMIPMVHDGMDLAAIELDGQPSSYWLQMLGAVSYAVVAIVDAFTRVSATYG